MGNSSINSILHYLIAFLISNLPPTLIDCLDLNVQRCKISVLSLLEIKKKIMGKCSDAQLKNVTHISYIIGYSIQNALKLVNKNLQFQKIFPVVILPDPGH